MKAQTEIYYTITEFNSEYIVKVFNRSTDVLLHTSTMQTKLDCLNVVNSYCLNFNCVNVK